MATDPRRPKPVPKQVTEPGWELVSLRRTVVAAGLLAVVTVLVLYTLVVFWPPAPAAPIGGPVAPTATTQPGTTSTETTAEAGPTTTDPTTTAVEPTQTTVEGTVPPTSPAYLPEPAGETTTTVVLQPAPNPAVRAYGAELQVDREARLFWVVALAGMLGGLIHAMRSLLWYAGNRNLKASWLPMYGLLPFVGMALAVVVYVVVRGGLIMISTQPSSDVVSPFGFAALAALAGLFSREAAEWLRGVFERVLTPGEPGRDTSVQPTITRVEPPSGPVGTPVTISGTGFIDVSEVSFGRAAALEWDTESETEISATVPDDAREGYVRVLTPGGTARSEEKFTLGEVARDAETPAAAPPRRGRAAGRLRRRGRRRGS